MVETARKRSHRRGIQQSRRQSNRQLRSGDVKGRVGIQYLTDKQGTALLDRQARKYLNMSGEEFRRKFEAGTIDDPDRSEVIRVSMILPLAGK